MNPERTARYLRAALALRGWRVQDLANALPPESRLSKRTLDEISRGRRVPREWEFRLIAEHLEVPEWFLRDGVSPASAADGDPDLAAAVEELVRHGVQQEQLIAELRMLVADLTLLRSVVEGTG